MRFDDCTTTIINYDANYHLFVSHARDANCFPDQDKKALPFSSLQISLLALIVVLHRHQPNMPALKTCSETKKHRQNLVVPEFTI